MGIIIFGASGAGSTTLGKEVARRLKFQYLDIDDYLWCWNTAIPLTVVRSREERAEHMNMWMYQSLVVNYTNNGLQI